MSACPPTRTQVKWVGPQWVTDTGPQSRLLVQGFTLQWFREDRLTRRLDLEGCEKVIVEENVKRYELRVRSPDSDLVLLRRLQQTKDGGR